MTDAEVTELKRREEAKRQRAQPPLTWQQIAEMLTWAEESIPPEQRRNRPRVHPANLR
jgi:hypothetical protein